MARILREAMNDISTNLRFTTESPSEFENRRLPTLDTELWVKDNQIHHSFYEKPTRTPLLIMENSGMAEHQKISILSNDLIRRLSNVGDSVGIEERITIIDNMTVQLKNSGYGWKKAREIIISGLLGLKRKVDTRKVRGEKFYRLAATTLGARVKKKLIEKTT